LKRREYKGIIDKTTINVALKFEMNKYCETKLISKMDIYFETEEVLTNFYFERYIILINRSDVSTYINYSNVQV